MTENKFTYQNNSDFILIVNEAVTLSKFLTEKMGFFIIKVDFYENTALKSDLKCINVINNYGNHYVLPVNNTNSIISKSIYNKIIVINTDDCLREYYNLKKVEEITSYSKPKYLPEGLAFEASDKWGNGYILLEKRNYIDD